MKVAVYYNNKDLRLEERPVPEISEGEILVKMKASGICGTDVMEWYRLKKAPRVLGHEMAGEVVKTKSEKFKEGQRVFVSHHVPCNECKYCKEGNETACETLHKGNFDPGGFSEFIRVPMINVEIGTYTLPDNVSYESGTMIEPLACGVRGVGLLNIKEDHKVLIMGCGVSGLLNIQIAKLTGAHVIAADIDEYRMQKARDFGADQVINANGEFDFKADKIIICTGAYEAVEKSFKTIDKKGTIMLFAIPCKNIEIPNVDMWRNELSITSSYGAGPADLAEALNLIKNGKVNVRDMITNKLPLEKIQEGFDIVLKAGNCLKVIVQN